MNIKQFFCSHKNKEIKKRIQTDRKREKSGQYILGLPIYVTYLYCDEYVKCLSCNKEYMEKKKYWVNASDSSVLY